MRLSDPLVSAAAAVAYGVVVSVHFHIYVRWTEQNAFGAVAVHAVSIAGFLASMSLCAWDARLGAVMVAVVNLCHNWLIHVWNTLLATTTFLSRLRLQGLNDFLCSLALSYCAIKGCKLRQPYVIGAVAYLLAAHSTLLFGQAGKVPGFDSVVVYFYPEVVVQDGGPLRNCCNLMRWLAVQADLVSNTVLTGMLLAQSLPGGTSVRK